MSNQEIEVKSRYQNLYKGKPDSWKETFRQRCIMRLRESRSKQFLSRRKALNADANDDDDDDDDINAEDKNENCPGNNGAEDKNQGEDFMDIQDIMKNEWDLMQKSVSDPSSTIDEMISLFEEIQSDLKEEELKLLQDQAQCDDFLKREEQELCHAIQRLNTVEVVCPVCENGQLMLNKGVILCMCGLRINTEQDGISLKNVQDNLTAGIDEHSKQCEGKNSFSQADQFGFTNLIMSCQDCDFLFIVV